MRRISWNLPWYCLALSVLVLAGQPAHAQNGQLRHLHVLIVADNLADQIEKGGLRDLERVKSTLRRGIPKELITIVEFKGDDVTADKVYGHYDGMKLGPNDGVLFYYSGHAEILKNPEPKHILTFCRGRNVHSEVSRTELRKKMQKTGAGLVILLTDCCSGFNNRRSAPPIQPVRPIRPSLGVTLLPAYRQLFFAARGLVDITAAEDGKLAWGDSEKEGGVFTIAFEKALTQGVDDGDLTWAGFYAVLKEQTELTAKDNFKKSQSSRSLAFLPGMSWGFLLYTEVPKISEVAFNSPAQRAGLQDDDVIVGVDDQTVTTWDECAAAIRASGPDMRLTVRDKNGKRSVKLSLQ